MIILELKKDQQDEGVFKNLKCPKCLNKTNHKLISVGALPDKHKHFFEIYREYYCTSCHNRKVSKTLNSFFSYLKNGKCVHLALGEYLEGEK